MDTSSRVPSPSPPVLPRSRSGTTTRLCHVSSTDLTPPFSPNLGRSRSRSASKSRPTPPSPRPKENRESPSPRDPGSNGRVRRTAAVAPSAWALSPGRSPAKEEPRSKPGWMRGGRVLGFLKPTKKELPAKEEDAHRLRVVYSRLLQWRFANARAETSMKARRSSAEKKLFYAWLRITELRNIVAAKRILIQRRKQKLKVLWILGPQVHVLNQWESVAKKNAEAVGALSRVLGAACLSLPLVEGAKVDMVSVHRHISTALNVMRNIEDTIRTFYCKIEKMTTLLGELVKTVTLEIEASEELMKTSRKAASLEMHEISVRANLIQVMKDEIFSTPLMRDDGIGYYHSQGMAFASWNDFPAVLMQVY
ncbi:putative QWRF family protein [Dioscorea sansibarensis]